MTFIGSLRVVKGTDFAGKVVLVPGHNLGNKTERFLQAALLDNLAQTKATSQGACSFRAPEELLPRVGCNVTTLRYSPLIFYQAVEESFPLKLYTSKSASYYSIKIVTVLLGGKGAGSPAINTVLEQLITLGISKHCKLEIYFLWPLKLNLQQL